jgi:hypothetical protein
MKGDRSKHDVRVYHTGYRCLLRVIENMPTLPTTGTLTAGATSSAARTESAPIARRRPIQIVVFPFATSAADVTLNQASAPSFTRNTRTRVRPPTKRSWLRPPLIRFVCRLPPALPPMVGTRFVSQEELQSRAATP